MTPPCTCFNQIQFSVLFKNNKKKNVPSYNTHVRPLSTIWDYLFKFRLTNNLNISCHRKYNLYNYYKIKLRPPAPLPLKKIKDNCWGGGQSPALDSLLYANIIMCAGLERGYRVPPPPGKFNYKAKLTK